MVSDFKALTTNQVYQMMFRKVKFGEKKAQERLRKLYRTEKLNRCRMDIKEPFIYYPGRRPGNIESVILLNQTYLWLLKQKKDYEIPRFKVEYVVGSLQADGFVEFVNAAGGKGRAWFIEVEKRGEEFTKIKKYNNNFQARAFDNEEWYGSVANFPDIIIVTSTQRRVKVVRELVRKENAEGLYFEVISPEEVYSLDN